MDPLGLALNVIQLANYVYTTTEKVKSNREKCKLLAETIQRVTTLIDTYFVKGINSAWKTNAIVQDRLETLRVILSGASTYIEGFLDEKQKSLIKQGVALISVYNIDAKFQQLILDVRQAEADLVNSVSLQVATKPTDMIIREFLIAAQDDTKKDYETIQHQLQGMQDENREVKELLKNIQELMMDNMLKSSKKNIALERSIDGKLKDEDLHLLPYFIEPDVIDFEYETNKKHPERIKLGAGGFGSVYRAKLRGSMPVAVKVVDAVGESALQELKHELDMMIKLSHHNIICFIGGFYPIDEKHAGESPFLVMEYAENNSLAHNLGFSGKKRDLSVIDKISIISDTADGLCYLHAHKIVHRDVKPDNILLTKENVAKLTDFGLSKTKSTSSSMMHTRIGTPLYLAPELMIAECEYTQAVDTWAFGVVMFECVVGSRMWQGLNAHQINHQVLQKSLPWDKIKPYMNEWPSEFFKIMKACLNFDYKNRPKSSDLAGVMKMILNIERGTATSTIEASLLNDLDSMNLSSVTQGTSSTRSATNVGSASLPTNLGVPNVPRGSSQRFQEFPETSPAGSTRSLETVDSMKKTASQVIAKNQSVGILDRMTDNLWTTIRKLEPLEQSPDTSLAYDAVDTSDPAQAVSYYTNQALAGDASAQHRLAQILEKGDFGVDRDLSKALLWYKESAAQNYAEAMYAIGRFYRQGLSVAENMEEAIAWYKRAAEQNHAGAYNALGSCFQLSSPEEAFTYYMEAATYGDASGCFNAGVCLSQGIGCEPDPASAITYYTKAAMMGKPRAMYNLALSFEEAKNYPQAFHWYKQASENEHIQSQYNLALFFYSGKGVGKSVEDAFKWFRRAAGHGLPEAMFAVAICYDKGHGVEADKSTALIWYRKAAERNSAAALVTIGTRYFYGDGVPKNPEEAVKHYRRAAALDNADAIFYLGGCYGMGVGVHKDIDTAIQYYKQGAEKNHAESLFALGLLCKVGQGLPKDPERSKQFFTRAARLNHAKARLELSAMK